MASASLPPAWLYPRSPLRGDLKRATALEEAGKKPLKGQTPMRMGASGDRGSRSGPKEAQGQPGQGPTVPQAGLEEIGHVRGLERARGQVHREHPVPQGHHPLIPSTPVGQKLAQTPQCLHGTGRFLSSSHRRAEAAQPRTQAPHRMHSSSRSSTPNPPPKASRPRWYRPWRTPGPHSTGIPSPRRPPPTRRRP